MLTEAGEADREEADREAQALLQRKESLLSELRRIEFAHC